MVKWRFSRAAQQIPLFLSNGEGRVYTLYRLCLCAVEIHIFNILDVN